MSVPDSRDTAVRGALPAHRGLPTPIGGAEPGDRLSAVLALYDPLRRVVLVPVALEFAAVVLGQWVECRRFRLEPRPDGTADLVVES